MTDSTLVLPPGWRATNTNGQPISGAKLKFYAAGTSTPITVYSDSGLLTALGSQVTCDSGGAPASGGGSITQVYTGTDAFKLVVTDADDVVIPSLGGDNIKGAVSIPATSSTALPQTPVVYKTTATPIVLADRGKVFCGDPTGGSFPFTLASASSLGDNFRVCVRHNGVASSNSVTVRTTGAQSIAFRGASLSSFALSGYGESVWISCDGAGFVVDSHVAPISAGLIQVVSRISAPPTSPAGGQRYIVSATPTGTWATLGFATNDVVEADGNGSWFKYAPSDGLLAYVSSEELNYQYQTSAWVALSNITAPVATTQPQAKFVNSQADGTGGGTATAAAWATVPVNTQVTTQNPISGASISTNDITLPTGTYQVLITQPFYGTYVSRIRLRSTTGSTMLYSDDVQAGFSAVGPTDIVTSATAVIFAILQVTAATETFRLEYFCSQTRTNGLGNPSTSTGTTETYAQVTFISLASQQGPRGGIGIQGTAGLDASHPFLWSTGLSGDPGSGRVGVDSATFASITQLRISQTDYVGSDLGNTLSAWQASTSSAKGLLKWSARGSLQNFIEMRVTGAGTDLGAYWTFPVSYVASGSTPLVDAAEGGVLFIEKGDKGDPGTTVPDPSGLATRTTPLTTSHYALIYDGATKKAPLSALFPFVTPEQYGCVGDGSTDDTTNFQAALNAVSAAGGGTLFCTNKYYLSNITVPNNVGVRGAFCYAEQYAVTSSTNYYNLPSQIKLATGASITMSEATSFEDMIVIRAGLSLPATDHASRVTLIGQFAGLAFTSTAGYQIRLANLLCLGHARICNFAATGGTQPGRVWLDHVRGDCTNGILLDSSGDKCRVEGCHLYPYLTFDPTVTGANEADHCRSGIGFAFQNTMTWTSVIDCFDFGHQYAFYCSNTSGVAVGPSGINFIGCEADHPSGANQSPQPAFYFRDLYTGGSATHGCEYMKLIACKGHGYAFGAFIDTQAPSGNDTVQMIGCEWIGAIGVEIDHGYLMATANLFQACTTGLLMSAGAAGYQINNNRFQGCTTAITNSVSSAAAGSNIRNNAGYNPVSQGALTVGASPYTYTAGASPEVHHLSGGTISALTLNGSTIATSSPVIPLEPFQAYTVTYTVAPTVLKRIL